MARLEDLKAGASVRGLQRTRCAFCRCPRRPIGAILAPQPRGIRGMSIKWSFWVYMSAIAALIATALPTVAQAQAGFDGTYAGVSATFTGAMGSSSRSCPQSFVPAPLSISGGRAQSRWNQQPVEGAVTPQGALIMHIASGGGRFDGQIDAQGAVRGTYNGFCSYTVVWQKRR
jgi:hypothetical protein